MTKHRLNIILKKCSDKEFRKGYIKYIKSLDYKEFESLFIYYNTIISILMIRYSSKDIKKNTKDWYKQKELDKKYDQLYDLFAEANFDYIIEFNKILNEKNIIREKLLKEIEEVKEIINSLHTKEVTVNLPPSFTDEINILMLISHTIFSKIELQRLMEELNNV